MKLATLDAHNNIIHVEFTDAYEGVIMINPHGVREWVDARLTERLEAKGYCYHEECDVSALDE